MTGGSGEQEYTQALLKQNLYSGHKKKCKRSEIGFSEWFLQLDVDSRQKEISGFFLSPLRSTIKLKTPAGEMPVELVTSRCIIAVLVEWRFSPEDHE